MWVLKNVSEIVLCSLSCCRSIRCRLLLFPCFGELICDRLMWGSGQLWIVLCDSVHILVRSQLLALGGILQVLVVVVVVVLSLVLLLLLLSLYLLVMFPRKVVVRCSVFVWCELVADVVAVVVSCVG